MSDIRVRFAPSPTGTLHIGGARTALFNYLFARHNKGTFVLRLEDTDTARSTADSAAGILEGLKWLGLDWDEGPGRGGEYGPYYQSERLSIYQHYLQNLLAEGQAYYCFCTPDELRQQREAAQLLKENYRYDGRCRSLSQEEATKRLRQGRQPVIRLKVPSQGHTMVHDLVRGEVEFENSLLDDFIIAKADGWPTYNFAVVVDDYTMKISHVIRAEEHLSNTPKQLLVYQALGFTPPQFAHVSMILAPDRSKLSKRHGATSVQEFCDDGYLPEALVNYLVLLGWSPGENIDIYPLQEMIDNFSLENVSRSAAVYDLNKLTWMNGHYLAEAALERIVKLIEPQAKAKGWLRADNPEYFHKAIELVRSRAKTSNEILDLAEYFFVAPFDYDTKGIKKYFCQSDSGGKLQAVLDTCGQAPSFTAPALEEVIRSQADQMGLKAAELIHPTRLALSGRTNTPGLFEVMELLGRKTCQKRLSNALKFIGQSC